MGKTPVILYSRRKPSKTIYTCITRLKFTNSSFRYSNLNSRVLKKEQVQHLLDTSGAPVDINSWQEKASTEKSKPIKGKVC